MDFWAFLQTLPGIIIILFVGTGILLTSLFGAWTKHCRKVRLAMAELELKTHMVVRGMSADEIERVLQSENGAGAVEETEEEESAESQSSALLAMIESGSETKGIVDVISAGLDIEESPNDVTRWMAEHGYEAEDIALVVAAMRRSVAAAEDRPVVRRQTDIELEVRESAPVGV